MPFNFERTAIQGPVILTPRVFHDERGWFMESFSARDLAEGGIPDVFVQDNLAYSTRGALRGLHFQKPPHAQAKLVTVLQGEALDVIVDIRKGSPTYGQWVSVLLNAENKKYFYVPAGFAHGYSVLSETCLFSYKCSNYYNKPSEGGLLWSDPALSIDWQIDNPIVSEKDQILPVLKDLVSEF